MLCGSVQSPLGSDSPRSHGLREPSGELAVPWGWQPGRLLRAGSGAPPGPGHLRAGRRYTFRLRDRPRLGGASSSAAVNSAGSASGWKMDINREAEGRQPERRSGSCLLLQSGCPAARVGSSREAAYKVCAGALTGIGKRALQPDFGICRCFCSGDLPPVFPHCRFALRTAAVVASPCAGLCGAGEGGFWCRCGYVRRSGFKKKKEKKERNEI